MDINNPLEVIIIGSGPAGLSAAIYAARAGLQPLVLAGYQPGGQLTTTTVVENYPGFPDGIDGPELMLRFKQQAEKFGAKLENVEAKAVDLASEIKRITTSEDKDYFSKAVIIATGATPRRLGIPGEEEFYGRGVSTCATCDGALYKGKVVAVVGGGDSAMEEATFLTRFATKVYLIHRREEFRASKIMLDRARQNPKIEFVLNTEVTEVVGKDGIVNKIRLNKQGVQSDLELDGLFLAIGHIPVTGFLNSVALNQHGYVLSQDGVNTNIAGVFVAGDVQDDIYRQAITAAGLGSRAAIAAQRWLESE